MSARRTRLLAAPLLALLVAPAARADHGFILPSSTALAGDGNVVTFDAAGSDHVFFFDHRPLQLGTIAVLRPDGSAGTPYNTLQGRFRSVFDLKLDQQGTWKVASVQTMIGGTFKLNGEERRVGSRGGLPRPQGGTGGPGGAGGASPDQRGGGDRPGGMADGRGLGAPGGDGPRRPPPVAFEDMPAEATDVHLIEDVRRIETFVTAGAPTTTVFTPTGKGLELDPITHPNAAAAGETARFRFLIDGKPASGLKVTVIPGGDRYRDEAGTIALTTGADGVVAIRWPAAGMYWLGVEAEDRHPAQPRAETRRMSYAATIEVMTP
jgi:hypothetical protein